VKERLQKLLKDYEVYLVFDSYHDFSRKCETRGAREAEAASRIYHLNLNTTLPAQKVGLTMTDNKKQIIQLIYNMMSCLETGYFTRGVPCVTS